MMTSEYRIAESTIEISKPSNLRILVSVIGYYSQGESIIVLFIDKKDNSVKYSIVIDYFARKNSTNHVISILKNYNVSKISMFCWTHPHVDHTRGLDSFVSQYFDDKTKIVIPAFYYKDDLMGKLLAKESKLTASIYTDALSQKDSYFTYDALSYGGTGNTIPIDLLFKEDKQNRNSDFIILTPNASVFRRKLRNGILDDINGLSLSFILSVDNYMFLFGGDTLDDHIAGINPELLEKVRWAKIPHHCSTGARTLPGLLKNLEIAVATVYKPQDLPNNHICDLYCMKRSEHDGGVSRFHGLYLTGKKNGNWSKIDNPDDFGQLNFQYDFLDSKVDLTISGNGNANKYQFISGINKSF